MSHKSASSRANQASNLLPLLASDPTGDELQVVATTAVMNGKACRHRRVADLRALIEAVQNHPKARLAPAWCYETMTVESPVPDERLVTILRLGDCQIEQADLEGLEIRIRLSIDRSQFLNKAKFDRARFCAATHFHAVRFNDVATFVGTSFGAQTAMTSLSFKKMAFFTAAQFVHGVSFGGSYMRHVFMRDVNLKGWSFDRVHGLRFDGNDLQGIRIPPRTTEAWFTVSRAYTGTRFVVHLIVLLCFAAGYAFRLAVWMAVNRAQTSVVDLADQIRQAAAAASARHPESAAFLADAAAEMIAISPSLTPNAHRYQVWEILLGLDRGWSAALLALTLLVYNGLRAKLTYEVGVMRDEVERTGFAPRWDDYKWSWYVHRYLMQWLVFVASISFLWHAWIWLTAPVWLPK